MPYYLAVAFVLRCSRCVAKRAAKCVFAREVRLARGLSQHRAERPVSTRLRTRLARVRFATGPKRSMGHFLGVEKNKFFNSRLTVPPRRPRRWNPVKIVVLRPPGGRLGSILDTCNRLRRVRRRFSISSKVLGSARPSCTSPQCFGSRALWRAPSASACGVGGYPLSELPP